MFEPQEIVLPEASGVPAADAVLAVDRPSLVMTRASDDGLMLAVTDPDLHLYEGRDPDQYDADGTFVGRVTSYSRPWRRNPSAPSTVRVTLAGIWHLESPHDRVTSTTSHAAPPWSSRARTASAWTYGSGRTDDRHHRAPSHRRCGPLPRPAARRRPIGTAPPPCSDSIHIHIHID